MAQVRYRANLSAKDFVYSSEDWGRSVVMKQYDQNFSRQIVSPTDPDKDIGIPQIFYGHNIMPAAQGFQSVGLKLFQQYSASIVGQPYQWLEWSSSGSLNANGYFLITYTGKVAGNNSYNIYAINATVGGITLVQNVVTLGNPPDEFTVALVNGVTYLFVPFTQCYSYNGVTWTAVTLTGLLISAIIGITAANGYMIAWSATGISWSSTLSATDFVPSLITGAGGGAVQGLKGYIVTCVRHIFGFIVFSGLNCVAAVYSGNARYPFNFREIVGGGGVGPGVRLIGLDSESGNLYAYTTAGLQVVSVTQAQVTFPEATNFLGGSRFEDFSDATLTFSETDVALGSFNRRLALIANRYLVLSYSITATFPATYTHALVYDIAMKRWGKIKFTHVQAVEAIYGLSTQNDARAEFCFVAANGDLYQVDFSQLATTGGTIILGRYQHARDRLITLQQVDLDFIPQTTVIPTLNVLTTFDGKTFQPPVAVPAKAATHAPQYPCRITGMNHSLCIQGIFRLASLMLTYTASGRR